MIRLSYSKTVLLVFALICFHLVSTAANLKTTLKRGIFSKQLTVKASSGGGYHGNCLKISVTNTSDKPLTVKVDPAMIFVPEDTNYQNLVTLGSEIVDIAPAATVDMSLHAYCGKSYARSPMANLTYKFSRQGDTNMVKTLDFVKENNISNTLAQAAVWMYTNGHCLNTVYSHQEPASSEKLVKFIAGIRKSKVPTIFTEFAQNDRIDQPAILPNGQSKLYVPVKWNNEERHMHVVVLRENGEIYKKVEGNDEIDKNGHTVWVEFNSVNDSKGIYYVELRSENNMLWYRKAVNIGYDPCQMM